MPRGFRPDGPCRLLELPQNVREKIWLELLQQPERIRVANNSTIVDLDLSILRTRRSIYHEATQVLFKENFFQFGINDRQGMNLPAETMFQKKVLLHSIRQMKRICIEVDIGEYDNPTSVVKVVFGSHPTTFHRYIQPSAFFLVPNLIRLVTFQHDNGLVRKIGLLRLPYETPFSFLDMLRTAAESYPSRPRLCFEEDSSKIFLQKTPSLPSPEAFAKGREWDMIYLCKLLKTLPELEELHVHVKTPQLMSITEEALKDVLAPFLQFRALRRARVTGVEDVDFRKKLEETMVKPKPTFNFLGLPGEIRNQIYRDALRSEEDINVQEDPPVTTNVRDLAVSLLGTNRQIFNEARPILYSENSFVAQVNVWAEHNVWKDDDATGPGITRSNARFIKKLRIVIDSRHRPHVAARLRDYLNLGADLDLPTWELWTPYCDHFSVVRTHIMTNQLVPRFSLNTVMTNPVLVRFPLHRGPFATAAVSEGLTRPLDDFIRMLDARIEQVANMLPTLGCLEELLLCFATSSAKWREWADVPAIQQFLHHSSLRKLLVVGYVSPGLGRDFLQLLDEGFEEMGVTPPHPITVDWPEAGIEELEYGASEDEDLEYEESESDHQIESNDMLAEMVDEMDTDSD